MSDGKFLFLSKDEIIETHRRVIEEFGGSHGLRDEGALESLYQQPKIANTTKTPICQRAPRLMHTI